MTRNEAQLQDDYGVIVGSLLNVPVVAPSGGLVNATAYNLVYNSSTKQFTLTAVTA